MPHRFFLSVRQSLEGKPLLPFSIDLNRSEQLKRSANVNITFVTYAGAAPAANALLGEHVTSVLISYAAGGEQVKAGKLRAIAVATPVRIDALSDVPTVAESGYAGYEADLWDGVVGSGQNAERNRRRNHWLVHLRDARPRNQTKACRPRFVSGRDLRRGFRRSYPQAIRRVRPRHSRVEH